MAKVEFKNVYKIFSRRQVELLPKVKAGMGKEALLNEYNATLGVNDMSLAIEENEFFVLMGLSGSGKSTVIRHVNGLIEPTAGEVLVDGQNVSGLSGEPLLQLRQRKVSMVFQKFALFPHKTVFENIAFGLRVRGERKEEFTPKVMHWLERVGLAGYENRLPRQLSGGMQQRVGIARALVVETEILMMDEPFSALDPLIRAEMQETMLGLRKELKKTILFVTHDVDEAFKLADRVAIMKDGALVQCGTPQELTDRPASDYVRRFTEKMRG